MAAALDIKSKAIKTNGVEALGLDRPLPIGSAGRQASGWWGMWLLIVTEAALFTYLLFGYYYLAAQSLSTWPPDGALPSLRLSGPNTVLLLLSSVCVWWGERGLRMGRPIRAVAGLATATVLGTVFVIVQVVEWYNKSFTLSDSVYGSLYFTTTGFHMAHVVGGLFVLTALCVWTGMKYFNVGRHAAVTIGAMYWHFVDAVWLAVFFTYYVTPYLQR